MFGHRRFLDMRKKAADLPHVEVSREEYMRLMMESGKSKEEAELQASIAEGLGASTMIGDQMVSIR